MAMNGGYSFFSVVVMSLYIRFSKFVCCSIILLLDTRQCRPSRDLTTILFISLAYKLVCFIIILEMVHLN